MKGVKGKGKESGKMKGGRDQWKGEWVNEKGNE